VTPASTPDLSHPLDPDLSQPARVAPTTATTTSPGGAQPSEPIRIARN
jgi:hypothetical protein